MIDMDNTKEISQFVDEKMVKIKRGYSPEFAKDYYTKLNSEVEKMIELEKSENSLPSESRFKIDKTTPDLDLE
jgi:hypothetical protein